MVSEPGEPVKSKSDQHCKTCGNPLQQKDSAKTGDLAYLDPFKLILDNMADLIAVIDRKGRRLYNSPSYRVVLDDPRSLQGTDSFMEIHPDDRKQLKDAFEKSMQTGEGSRMEYRFVRKDGTIRHIESQGDVIRDPGGRPSKLVVVSRDITDRKEREEEIRVAYQNLQDAQSQIIQSEKLASIGQLAAGIVHDLKNPLGIVLNGTEFLTRLEKKSENDNHEAFTETISLMQEAVNRANKMVQGLLSLSRKEDLKLTAQQMNDEASRAIEAVKSGQSLNGTEVTGDLMDDAPPVLIDKDQIQQVLINLISNAIQAMPGGGKVTVSTSSETAKEGNLRVGEKISDFFKPGGRVLVVAIADTGTGIPPETLKKIFEPFFTTKPRGEGTGLGLAIVRSIIEGHRGTIEATSKVGKGTTFRITLPIPS